jgi:hypothetical protein
MPAVLAQLETELARQLSSAGSVPPSAPHGSGTAPLVYITTDASSAGPGTMPALLLQWAEALPGDLDLNGEVNSADLQPLARFFNLDLAEVASKVITAGGPSDVSAWFARLDGDGNGVLTLGDIKPIADHFNQRLDGYRVYRRQPGAADWQALPDPAAPSNPLAAMRLPGAPSPPQPLVYTFTESPAPTGELEYMVVPVYLAGAQEGTPSNARAVRLYPAGTTVNIWAARLTQFPNICMLGEELEVVFNLMDIPAASFPVQLEFDVDSDGRYEARQTVSAPADGIVQRLAFAAAGTYPVRVRIASPGDGQSGFWTEWPVAVRDGNRPPQARLQLLLDDRSAPSYLSCSADGTNDPDGDQLTTEFLLQRPGQRAPQLLTDLQLTEPGEYKLVLVATDALGAVSKASASFVLDAAAALGSAWRGSSVYTGALPYNNGIMAAQVGGHPALLANGQLYTAASADGGQWASAARPPAPEPDAQFGTLYQLADVNGRPALVEVAARGMLDWSMYYTVAQDAAGSSWSPAFLVPSGANPYVDRPLLGVVAGRPALAWPSFSGSGPGAWYLRANDDYGLDWPAAPQFVSLGSSSRPNLCSYAGRPALLTSVTDSAGHTVLALTEALDAAGTQWGNPRNLLTSPIAASTLQLSFPHDGLPLVSGMVYSQIGQPSGPDVFQAALNASGSLWSPPQALPLPADDIGQYPDSQVALCGGRPCVAYLDRFGQQLMFSMLQDGTAIWSTPETIDNRGNCSNSCLLLEVDGAPAVFYDAQLTFPNAGSGAPAQHEVRFARRQP